MPRAQRFTFLSFSLNRLTSTLTNSYAVFSSEEGEIHYVDRLEFPGVSEEMWNRIPEPVLEPLLQALHIALGINYWKLHLAREIRIEGFSLTKAQAQFWDTLYTKGLAEFFYKAQIDFRGIVAFPYEAKEVLRTQKMVLSSRALLLLGGGKDSIVAAEMLSSQKIPFDLFVLNPVRMHEQVAQTMRRNIITVRRQRSPNATRRLLQKSIPVGLPFISIVTFVATLTALVRDYRFVVLSNEYSADIANVNYLGLDVNHQWSKSSESETMIRNYVERYITPSCTSFSLIRPYTEIEMVRRFSAYPKYFFSFASCNENFLLTPEKIGSIRQDRAYWCNRCPKCVFMFACMTAFVPKETALDIFGVNLHAEERLLTTYKELLGLEGFKPFECVGTPEEMIVAMHRTRATRAYDTDPAIDLFTARISLSEQAIAVMEKRVFATHEVAINLPREFVSFDPKIPAES